MIQKTRATITFILIFAWAFPSFAKEKDLVITASGGISYVNLQDSYFSAILYHGVAGLASIRLTTITASYWDDLSLFFRDGRLAMDISSAYRDANTHFIGGNIHYSHVRKLKPRLNAKQQFGAGGNFSSSADFYKRNLYGDNYGYLYQSSVGPSFAFRYSLKENGRLQISTQADLSLFSYIVCPSYGSVMPERLLEKELSGITSWNYITGGKILAINKFQRINWTASLTCGISDKISLLLGYSWEFIHLKREDDLLQAIHNIQLAVQLH
jgi:hypothetical protein